MAAPAPYVFRRIGSAELVSLPEELHWAGQALVAHGSLHAFAAAHPGGLPMRGRGTAYRIFAGDRNVVVRHYHRGGAPARLLGDRYLRTAVSRPERELIASIAARERGIPTPRIVAFAVYPTGIFYRADLVTEEIPDAADLAAIVFGDDVSKDQRRSACLAAAHLIAQAARAGILHRDANAMNILIEKANGSPRAHLLDLDRARVVGCADARALQRTMTNRLLRSLRKLQKRADSPGAEELSILEFVISSAA
jgi:3-deoxy-D-manno-octulosonic acid kinase